MRTFKYISFFVMAVILIALATSFLNWNDLSSIGVQKSLNTKQSKNQDVTDSLDKEIENINPHNLLLSGDKEKLASYLAQGGNPNYRSYHEPASDMTLLMAASYGGMKDEYITLLLNHGAEVHLKNEHGNTALHIASRQNFPGIIRKLITHGAELNMRGYSGYTPLMLAAQEGNSEAIDTLLDHDAKINLVAEGNWENWNALALAIQNEHFEVAKTLLDHGANPMQQLGGTSNWDSYTPFHLAIVKDRPELVRLMVEEHDIDFDEFRKSEKLFDPYELAQEISTDVVSALQKDDHQ